MTHSYTLRRDGTADNIGESLLQSDVCSAKCLCLVVRLGAGCSRDLCWDLDVIPYMGCDFGAVQRFIETAVLHVYWVVDCFLKVFWDFSCPCIQLGIFIRFSRFLSSSRFFLVLLFIYTVMPGLCAAP